MMFSRTRYRLTVWGRWARGGLLGLPTMSLLERFKLGPRGHESYEMPHDIAEIDHLVCTAPASERQVLIVFYAQQGQMQQKAARVGLDRHRFRRILHRAESYIESNL